MAAKTAYSAEPQQEGGQVRCSAPRNAPIAFVTRCAAKERGKIQGTSSDTGVADGDRRHDQTVQKQPAAGRQTQSEEYPEHQHHPHENTGPVPDLLQDPATVRRAGICPSHHSALGTALNMPPLRRRCPQRPRRPGPGDQILQDLTGDLDHDKALLF